MKKIDDLKPVFVVGMNGSGTTMLLDCLNNHPELYGFRRETKILPYYIVSLTKYGNLKNDDNFLALFNDFRSELVFKIVNGGNPVPLPEDWRELPRNLAAVVDYTFMFFAQKEVKNRWCEKTPAYAMHIEKISQLFPHAKFIHIIRDGRDCAASLHRRWGYKPEAMIFRWKTVVREAKKQGELVGARYHEVYYEELTKDPVGVMKTLCGFIDVPFVYDVIGLSRIRNFTGSKSTEIIINSERWRSYFRGRQLGRMERISGHQLERLGYVSSDKNSDNDPPRFVLLYWLYFGYGKDMVRRIWAILWRKDCNESLKDYFLWLKTRLRTNDRTQR